jgi:hypothetical protein
MRLNVSISMVTRNYVQPGESFTVEAVVRSNMPVRGVNVTFEVPKSFGVSTERQMTVHLDDLTDKIISWEVTVPDYMSKGEYPVSIGLVDPEGDVKSVTQSVSVLMPTRIQVPVANVHIDIPQVSVIQDKTFTAIKSYFVVIYSQRTLMLLVGLILLCAGYLYYSHRKRNSLFV